ncbi:MAG: sigma-70 family RNA polymerase sigma factor [Cytophagaceae bacterium]|nr:sigma-70 family RNA polymerase sigma factor [Cytophagaceae bacterium]
MNSTDFKIIESIRKGSNDQVLAYLYDKPLRKIRKYILSNKGSAEDANDIFQDAVVILFNQVKKNKYNHDYDLDGFLYAVARNLWVDRMRREKIMVTKDFTNGTDHADFNDHLEDLIVKEKSAALRKAFEKLDEKCRKILHYVVYEKLNMREISEKMGYSNENVAKSNHYRCKQYLASMVKEDKDLLNLLQN